MKKRLRHHADAIIGMLTGWQMYGNYKYFAPYGLGHYTYDYRKNEFLFEDKPIDIPPIFTTIYHWFKNEIKKQNIDLTLLKTTKIKIHIHDYEKDITVVEKKLLFFKYYKDVEVESFKAQYKIEIKTAENDYSKSSFGIIMY